VSSSPGFLILIALLAKEFSAEFAMRYFRMTFLTPYQLQFVPRSGRQVWRLFFPMSQWVIARTDVRNDRRRTRRSMFDYSTRLGIFLHNAGSLFGYFFDIVSSSCLFHDHYHYHSYQNRKNFDIIFFYVRHGHPERHKTIRLLSIKGPSSK
jgi:hypothetical protein